MRHKRFEVSVAMQQHVSAFNASRGDDRVNRFAHRDAKRSQCPEVLRSLYCDVSATKIDDFQRVEELLSLLEVTITRKTLQHLGQDHVANCKRLSSKQTVKFLGLHCGGSAEVFDPDAGINKNHLSVLIASKSPSQVTLPRSWRICSCWRKRSTVRNPSSTASRFVFKPVARSVSFINLSSISMLVRTVCTPLSLGTHTIYVVAGCGNAPESDHSIEGTANGEHGSCWLPRTMPPSSAPHVKR